MTDQTSEAPMKWTSIATLLRPQGRRGELLSEPLTDLPDVFATGRSVWLVAATLTAPQTGAQPITLEEHFFPTGKNSGRIVLKLSVSNSINDAEKLAGQKIMIPAAEMPKLSDGTFFVSDLVDCDLYDGDQLIGKVVDLHFPTTPDGRTRLEDAAPLLIVEPTGLTEEDEDDDLLIPFVNAWLDNVDTTAKRITMHLPAGLSDGDELE